MGKRLSQLGQAEQVKKEDYLLVDGQNYLESKKIPFKDINLNNFNTDGFYNQNTVDSLLEQKQNSLVSGKTIKTINDLNLLGEGNITIVTDADQTYNPTSENAQSGKAVAEALSGYVMAEVGKGLSSNDFTNEDKEKLYSALQNENIDKTYNPTSENAQSGKAVSEAVSTEQKRADNTFANALKGTKSDTAMLLDDVSPVEHTMTVKVSSDTVTDLTSVKLKKFGANMLDLASVSFASYQPNTTWKIENGNLEFSAVSNSFFYSRNISAFNLKPNCTYTCTATVTLVDNGSTNLGSAGTMGLSLLLQTNPSFDSSGKGKVYIVNGSAKNNKPGTYKIITTFTTPADMTDFTYIATRLADNTAVTFANMQIQAGTMATDYESYAAPVEYTPNADGTVEGVTSIYPATNLTTDTDGVIIGCVYNRDINKAFAELQAAIATNNS